MMTRAARLARAYLDYLVQTGPILTYILREPHPDTTLDRSITVFRQLVRKVATELRVALRFAPREALVTLELLSAIPESLAVQVRDGRTDIAIARDTCDRLMRDLVSDLQVKA